MKVFTGTVISTKMSKTAKVAVERIVAHPVYKKRVKKTRYYLVHDELGVKDGQTVKFVASKPYSKMKRWKIMEVVGAKTNGKSKIASVKKTKSGNKKGVKAKEKKNAKKANAK